MSTTKPFDPFRSERLVYRAVNGPFEDDKFVHSIFSDAEAQSGISYKLFQPETQAASREFKYMIDAGKCLLGAIICLQAPGSEDGNRDVAGQRIGIVCLKSTWADYAHHRWANMGVDIVKNHRGQGYGSEAILWSLWYAFQMAGLHRVQAGSFSFNERANKLYKRLGFREEGRHRDAVWFDGGWHDYLMYGMLEDEWRDMQREAGKEVKDTRAPLF